MRLAGTTKTTLQAIRDRTHWNSAALTPADPVTLGLCSQLDLDAEVNRAAKERPQPEEDRGQTLVPSEVTTRESPKEPMTKSEVFASAGTAKAEPEASIDVDSVFAKLKDLNTKE
jgi:hypothetical protein